MPADTVKINGKYYMDFKKSETESVIKYNSGADMWRDYMSQYGEIEARGICNRYLDMQIRTQDSEELQFCRELYEAMKDSPIIKEIQSKHEKNKTSILDGLTENIENIKNVQNVPSTTRKAQYELY